MIVIEHAHCFSQKFPSKTCPHAVDNILASLHKGYEVKCRDPRCCYQGAAVWSYRHALCVNRLLAEHIPDDMAVYRGNLRLPPDAPPAAHRNAKDVFLQRVNRWKTPHGYRVELHGILHISTPTDAHWDVTAYSNAPKTSLKATISEAWRAAGGRSQSLVPVAEEDIIGAIRYQAKDTTRPERATRYLPASQDVLGFNRVWSTRASKGSAGFWNGTSEEAVWKQLKDEYVASLGDGAPILNRNFRLRMTERLRALTPDADDILKTFEWHETKLNELKEDNEFFTKGDVDHGHMDQ